MYINYVNIVFELREARECYVLCDYRTWCVNVCVCRGAPKQDFLRQYICTEVTVDTLAPGFWNREPLGPPESALGWGKGGQSGRVHFEWLLC